MISPFSYKGLALELCAVLCCAMLCYAVNLFVHPDAGVITLLLYYMML